MSKTAPRSVAKSRTTRGPARPSRRREDGVLVGAPLERVWRVHARLSREERVTAETLAAELDVSVRTVMRDLDVMRDRLGMPIEWDPVEGSYYYTRACDALPLLRIDAREALALAVAGRMFDRRHGSPFGRLLASMVRKIAPVFGGAVSVAVESVENALSQPTADADAEFEHFFPLLEAILNHHELRLDYAKPHAPKAEKRLVHPLHLAELDQRWVLVAFDRSRRALRTFVLTRIRGLEATGSTFTPPPDFNPQDYLRGCLGRFAGDGDYVVHIALDSQAAFYAREKPWHHSQQLTARPDGRVELTLRLNHLAEIRNIVLRWGPQAEVLAPPELRAEVRDAHRAALERYERQEGGERR